MERTDEGRVKVSEGVLTNEDPQIFGGWKRGSHVPGPGPGDVRKERSLLSPSTALGLQTEGRDEPCCDTDSHFRPHTKTGLFRRVEPVDVERPWVALS